MKVIVANLLVVLGRNLQPFGKDITEFISSGREKLALVPSDNGVTVVVSTSGVVGAGAAAAPTTVESKKEEKEESDEVFFKPTCLQCIYFYLAYTFEYIYGLSLFD
uniref:Uncharacterized protein n=1 Tax=Nelumbo nucifera TaxID=4432 RepID=A0A822XD46_NELNU|nr:TPA_asm: hypothetical protein HUJ06_020817 [Nelumbo nucifera]